MYALVFSVFLDGAKYDNWSRGQSNSHNNIIVTALPLQHMSRIIIY